jgi:hypothetical protein
VDFAYNLGDFFVQTGEKGPATDFYALAPGGYEAAMEAEEFPAFSIQGFRDVRRPLLRVLDYHLWDMGFARRARRLLLEWAFDAGHNMRELHHPDGAPDLDDGTPPETVDMWVRRVGISSMGDLAYCSDRMSFDRLFRIAFAYAWARQALDFYSADKTSALVGKSLYRSRTEYMDDDIRHAQSRFRRDAKEQAYLKFLTTLTP